MKTKFYFILLLLFSCKIVIAQESFPNIEDNPNWKVVNTITSYPETKTLLEYQLEKDTLINSVTYQKVTNNAGYIRILNDKVFYRLKSDSKDFLLYDFGLNVNDTVYCGFYLNEDYDVDTVKFWVVDVESISLDGEKRKMLKMNYSPITDTPSSIFSMNWIEDVGSTSHPFYSAFLSVAPGSRQELLCFHLGDAKIFQNSSYSDCSLTTSLNDVQKNSNIQIFPNPCFETCIIKGVEQGTFLKIFNSNGQVILTNFIKYSEVQISTVNWISGVYYIQLTNENNNSIFNQKIIKQ